MSDHFALPPGPVAIQVSGGRTSAYMLRRILDTYGGILPADCHVLFQNTGREMPETLDFVQAISDRWSVPVTWLEYRRGKPGYEVVGHNSASRDGAPFEALIRARKYLPNQAQRFCTQELKIRPSIRYLRDGLGWKRWHAVVGIRADEAHRATRTTADRERFTPVYPLVQAGITKRDVAAFWYAQPFDLGLANINGKTPLGNCDGCFLKSEVSRARLCRDHPDRAEWWDRMEVITTATAKGDAARFDKRIAWRELRDFADRQPEWAFDDQGGVFCDSSLGGCFDDVAEAAE